MKKAEHDLVAAEINLQQKLFDVSAFLSHQAAEKALKALYILKFKRLWKIHNLVDLAEKAGAPEDVVDTCDKLNPHYLVTRYPLDEEYTEAKAEEALSYGKEVVTWAKESLKKTKK